MDKKEPQITDSSPSKSPTFENRRVPDGGGISPDSRTFQRKAAFEMQADGAVAVGSKCAALITGPREVTTIEEDGERTFQTDHPATDVAVGEYVYLLLGSQLVAVTEDGAEIWATDIGTAGRSIAALLERNVVGVVTDDELIVYDGATGDQQTRRERPHKDAVESVATSLFIGGFESFFHTAWSFVTAFSATGKQLFDVNLNSVVLSLGVTDDTVVVSLKGDELVGLNSVNGDKIWSEGIDCRFVAPVGGESILLVTGNGVEAVTNDGNFSSVSNITGDRIYVPVSGHLVCAVEDTEAVVYRHQAHTIDDVPPDITVESDRIQVGEELHLTVENPNHSPKTIDIRLEAEDVIFDKETKKLTVDPETSTDLSYRITEVAGTSDREIGVYTDGTPVTTRKLVVVDSEPDIDVDAGLSIDAIEGATADLLLEIHNDTADRAVSLHTPDLELLDAQQFQPGEQRIISFESEYDPGKEVTVTVEQSDGLWSTVADVMLPSTPITVSPTVLQEGDGDFVDIDVTNGIDVPVTETMEIQLPNGDWLSRQLSLDPGENILIAVPVLSDGPQAGTVSVEFPDLDLVEEIVVERTGSKPGHSRAAQGEEPPSSEYSDQEESSGESATERPESEFVPIDEINQKNADPSQDTTRDQSPPDQKPHETRSDSSRASVSNKTGSDTRPETPIGNASEDEQAHPEQPHKQSDHSSDMRQDVDRTSVSLITIYRQVDDSPAETLRFEEEIRFDTHPSVAALQIDYGDESVDLDVADETSIDRNHAAFVDQIELPAITARDSSGETHDRIDAETVQTRVGPFRIQGSMYTTNDRPMVAIEFTNTEATLQVPCQILGIAIGNIGQWRLSQSLAPGDSIEWSQPLDGGQVDLADYPAAIPVDVAVRFQDRDIQKFQSLLARSIASTTPWPIDVTLSPETGIDEERGFVKIKLQNTANRELRSLSVTASGEYLNDLLYENLEVDTLAPGASITHTIDVKPDGRGSIEIPVAVTVGSDDRTERLRLVGPTPVTGKHGRVSKWTVKWESDSEESFPELLSTPLQS